MVTKTREQIEIKNTPTLKFTCNHETECSKPETYCCYAQYIEIWQSNGLVEIIPDESEPHGFVCTGCNAEAKLEVLEPIKKDREKKVANYRQEQLL